MSLALVAPSPQRQVSVPAQTSIGTAAAIVLAENGRRKGLVIVNTGTTIIKLNFSTTLPTQTVYHVALGACTAADDGRGGAWTDDAYVGPVSAVSSGAGGTFVITEFETGYADLNQAGEVRW